jgi:Ca2+-binding EF-hand superfamily protein
MKPKTPRPQSKSSFAVWLVAKEREEAARQPEDQRKESDNNQEASQDFLRSAGGLISGFTKKAEQKVVRDMGEIQAIFNKYDQDQSGTLEQGEFTLLLAKLLKMPTSALDTAEVMRNWAAVDADGSGTITFDEFQTWYCSTFKIQNPDYTEFFTTSKDIELSKDEKMIRDVAKHLDMGITDIEKLHEEYGRLDADGSGDLGFEEFKSLLAKQLMPRTRSSCAGSLNPGEVPNSIAKKFWNDLAPQGQTSVNFPDFAAWYVAFFMDDNVTPMEMYYKSIAGR